MSSADTSLDPEAADEVLALLRRLANNERLGVLCVLHQPDLALKYAHRLVGLRQGRVMFDAPAHEVDAGCIEALYRAEAR